MGDAEDDATLVISAERATDQYLDGVEAGNSQKNFQSALARWHTRLEAERDVTTLDELGVSIIADMYVITSNALVLANARSERQRPATHMAGWVNYTDRTRIEKQFSPSKCESAVSTIHGSTVG